MYVRPGRGGLWESREPTGPLPIQTAVRSNAHLPQSNPPATRQQRRENQTGITYLTNCNNKCQDCKRPLKKFLGSQHPDVPPGMPLGAHAGDLVLGSPRRAVKENPA